MCNPSQGFYGENNLDDEMTETTITKENIMYQMPPDELLYEWFREAQTSKTEKFTVEMYDDGGYATNAYDVIFRVVEWCNSRKELKPVKITAELTITPEEFEKWCDGDILPTERMYHQFIEGTIYNKFETTYDFGEYKDYINTTIDVNGMKFTFDELT